MAVKYTIDLRPLPSYKMKSTPDCQPQDAHTCGALVVHTRRRSFAADGLPQSTDAPWRSGCRRRRSQGSSRGLEQRSRRHASTTQVGASPIGSPQDAAWLQSRNGGGARTDWAKNVTSRVAANPTLLTSRRVGYLLRRSFRDRDLLFRDAGVDLFLEFGTMMRWVHNHMQHYALCKMVSCKKGRCSWVFRLNQDTQPNRLDSLVSETRVLGFSILFCVQKTWQVKMRSCTSRRFLV